MEIKQDWNGTRLQDYLLFGNWSPYFAFCTLSGLDGNFVNNHGFNGAALLDSTFYIFSDEQEKIDRAVKIQFENSFNRLREFWHSDGFDDELFAPSFYIDWALSKRFQPDWLNWAIRNNLYQTSEAKILATINIPTYETDLLKLLNFAVLEFFNPRKVSDAKKEEVTQWLKDKGAELDIAISDNVADSIFTIIKPKNHNPKIKRVQPLD